MIEEKIKEGFVKFYPKSEVSESAECELIEFEKKHYFIELFPKGAWPSIGRIWEVVPFIPAGKPMSIYEVNLRNWREKEIKEREYLARFVEPLKRKEGLYQVIESTKHFDHFN